MNFYNLFYIILNNQQFQQKLFYKHLVKHFNKTKSSKTFSGQCQQKNKQFLTFDAKILVFLTESHDMNGNIAIKLMIKSISLKKNPIIKLH